MLSKPESKSKLYLIMRHSVTRILTDSRGAGVTKNGLVDIPSRDRFTFNPTTSAPADKIGFNSMPSPLGEGQTDMPINRHDLGEVHPIRVRLSF